MAFHKYVGNFRSSNGKNRIAYYVYEPECVVQGIVQISHGMCEYLEMYEELIGVLCDHGLLVCGNDHLGHGNSVSLEEDFGYFGEKDGWICLVKDLKKMNGYIRKEYPDVPCFLLGHSMGSFVARLYTSFYGDSIDGAIFLGTSGKIRGLVGALGILRGYRKVRDDRYRSEMINQIAFGTYNRRYRDEKDDFSWLCHSEEFRKQYVTEERNRFIFTLGGLTDLVSLLYYISQKKWYEKIPKELPFLLMGGTEDPVGQYGKGIREVCRKMKKAGCQDVTMQLYPGNRHVLLHEEDKDQVMKDLVNWIWDHMDDKKTR